MSWRIGVGDRSAVGSTAFDAFVAEHGEALRRALVAAYGVDLGADVWADALAWAWEHRDRLETMANPVGYLFRVGQSASRRHRRWRRTVAFPPERASGSGDAARDETGDQTGSLDDALATLPRRQRTAALLVHAYGWSYGEVAEATGVSVASVRNDLHRAMKTLRQHLEAP